MIYITNITLCSSKIYLPELKKPGGKHRHFLIASPYLHSLLHASLEYMLLRRKCPSSLNLHFLWLTLSPLIDSELTTLIEPTVWSDPTPSFLKSTNMSIGLGYSIFETQYTCKIMFQENKEYKWAKNVFTVQWKMFLESYRKLGIHT